MKKSFVEALIEKKVLVIIVCILVMMGVWVLFSRRKPSSTRSFPPESWRKSMSRRARRFTRATRW